MKNRSNLIYALKDGVAISIENVERGLQCGCVCPACGERLVAKKGSKQVRHFAHYSNRNCAYGYESSLHLAAKEILSKAHTIVLPAVNVLFPDSYKEKEEVCCAKEIQIEKVELEKNFQTIVPDVVIFSGGKKIFLEIYVTHAIDEKKLEKLKEMGISTIEVDLSKRENAITYHELETILLQDSKEKQWKYNAVSSKWLKRFYNAADLRALVKRGYAIHVDDCPINMRSWRGKSYANYIDDCLNCEYCISAYVTGGMLCSGNIGISTLRDFTLSSEQRFRKKHEKIEQKKMNMFAAGICPNCGGKLIERQGKYGNFLGCSNYPHCRFTANLNTDTGEIEMKA